MAQQVKGIYAFTKYILILNNRHLNFSSGNNCARERSLKKNADLAKGLLLSKFTHINKFFSFFLQKIWTIEF